MRKKEKGVKCSSQFKLRCGRAHKVAMKRRDNAGSVWGAPGEGEGVLLGWLSVLRWLGLSFTRVRRAPGGELVASDSRFHLVVNVAIAGAFFLAFCCINPVAFASTGHVKTPSVVYLLYTKLMMFTIVVLSVCGNVYNRKFISIIELFWRVSRDLERDFGRSGRGEGRGGCRILLGLCLYVVASTALNLWTDSHLANHYERAFRIVHYFCYFYVILFTAHFAITMNYMREKFKFVNGLFRKVVAPGRGPRTPEAAAGASRRRKSLGAWMAAFMDLREAEGLANDIFGKQIFLIMLLAFSRVIVNAYYLITLNLYEASTWPLNVTMCVGILQAVTVAMLNTVAAEMAANEVNKINDIIFDIPVHLNHWETFAQVRYFAFFSHCYPVEFKVWIFYALNYDSLLKVILTSSAITVIILQCDFLKADI